MKAFCLTERENSEVRNSEGRASSKQYTEHNKTTKRVFCLHIIVAP